MRKNCCLLKYVYFDQINDLLMGLNAVVTKKTKKLFDDKKYKSKALFCLKMLAFYFVKIIEKTCIDLKNNKNN